MNRAYLLVGSMAALCALAYGCGSSGNATTSTSASSAGGHSASSSSNSTTSTAGGTGGVVGTGGAGGAGATTCNPFTGAPCDLAKGASCDYDFDGKFHCFPSPNEVELCGACGVDPPDGGAVDYCAVGLRCLDSNKCAAFCCDDGDCGAGGKCDKTILDDGHGGHPSVGVCTNGAELLDAGAGGGAPAPEPGCNAPAKPPSNGACFMP